MVSETQLASMRLGAVETDAERIQRQKSGNIIFILDGQTDEVLGFIHRENVIENKHRKSLKDTMETFDMTIIGDKPYAEHLGKRNGLIVPGEDGELLEFRIHEVVKYRQGGEILIDVYANATYLDLKKAKVYDPHTTNPMTAIQHATEALNGTEWRVGKADFAGVRTLTFEEPFNPYTYLKRIAREFELELRFYVTTDGNEVTGRYVDIVEQVGEWRGRTVEFGQDLQGIERREREDVVTALYGYGPEREDGTRLKVFVEDLEALRRWGRNGRHLIDIYEPDSADQDMTEERLRQLTRAELDKRINTSVEYRADINDLEYVPGMENKKIRFGDTIRIKDTKFNPALYLEARVHTQERDVFNKNRKRIELGDFEEFTEEEVRAIWRQLQEQIRQKISQAELVEYAERKVQRDVTPPQETEHLWLDTSVEPNVLKRYDETAQEWVKATPTEADEVGAETPEGAQQKADEAKQEAISYSENFTINYAQKQITSGSTPPANPEIGDLWFDNSTQPPTFRRWNGTEWEKLSATTFEELEGMIDKEQLPDRVIDAEKLAIDAVQAENLAEGSVYAEAIQAEAVGAQAIAANAILAKHIAAGEVTANHLSADAVTADAIAAGAILAEHLSSGSIKSEHISTEGLNANVIKTGTLSAITLDGVDGTFTGIVKGGRIEGSVFETSGADGSITIAQHTLESLNADSTFKLLINAGVISVQGLIGDGEKYQLDPIVGLRSEVGANFTEYSHGKIVWYSSSGVDPLTISGSGSGVEIEDKAIHLRNKLAGQQRASISNDDPYIRIYPPRTNSLANLRFSNTGQLGIANQDGSFVHLFNADGSKSGGSFEFEDGKIFGMSPIDSPQVPIEYFIFDQEVTEAGVTVMLDERFSQATEGTYAVFTSGAGVAIEKHETSFILRGQPQVVDIRIVALRRGYTDQFWVDMNEKKGDEQ